MRPDPFKRLVAVDEEYRTARAAVGVLGRAIREIPLPREAKGITPAQVRDTTDRLESTYVIRLFAEFEGTLASHLADHLHLARVPRTARSLIERVGSHHRMDVAVRDGAHAVRDYRNTLVHPLPAPVPALSFGQALSRLSTFLSWRR